MSLQKKTWLIPVGLAILSFVCRQLFGSKKDPQAFESHSHAALDHEHDHVHVTHYRSEADEPVGGWDHLTAEHRHAHNHPAVEHSHRPHHDFDREHRREAHVHDHEHPSHS